MTKLQNPIVNTDTILNYIPQRPPIVLVSRIYECDESSIITGFDITTEHIFTHEGKLSESGIIENMAQSAACRAGYEAIKNSNKPVVGFIGNIKNLNIHFLPTVNSEIYTKVITKTQVLNVSIIDVVVYSDSKIVAECEMKIFLQDNQ